MEQTHGSTLVRSARRRRPAPGARRCLRPGRSNMEQRIAIEELVYRSCLAPDARHFKGFLDLCDAPFHYSITAYSPEIRKDMIWLAHDRAGIETLFPNLPRH